MFAKMASPFLMSSIVLSSLSRIAFNSSISFLLIFVRIVLYSLSHVLLGILIFSNVTFLFYNKVHIPLI